MWWHPTFLVSDTSVYFTGLHLIHWVLIVSKDVDYSEANIDKVNLVKTKCLWFWLSSLNVAKSGKKKCLNVEKSWGFYKFLFQSNNLVLKFKTI